MRRIDPLPYGLALLGLGAGTLTFTLLSIAEDHVTYARAVWTALLAMLLAAPAAIAYPLGAARDNATWRGFWTAGLVAYAMHLWWSVGRIYDWHVGAVVAHQGWVAFTNAIVTVLWGADVLLAWVPLGRARLALAIRFSAWLGVTASFVIASALFGAHFQPLGILLGLAILISIAVGLWRRLSRRPVASPDLF
jgi:hypothetical protein